MKNAKRIEKTMDGEKRGLQGCQWLTLAEKLLRAKDFPGARKFATRAGELDRNVQPSADQIITIANTLIAGDLLLLGNSKDYYAILQLGLSNESDEIIEKQYRKLLSFLNPDCNKFPFSDIAFRLVSEAWNVLSDSERKALYDYELQKSQLDFLELSKEDDRHMNHQEPVKQQSRVASGSPSRKSLKRDSKCPFSPSSMPSPTIPLQPADALHDHVAVSHSAFQISHIPNSVMDTPLAPAPSEASLRSFWTACSSCKTMFEFPSQFEGCCLKCQNCTKPFEASPVPAPQGTGNNSPLFSGSPSPSSAVDKGDTASRKFYSRQRKSILRTPPETDNKDANDSKRNVHNKYDSLLNAFQGSDDDDDDDDDHHTWTNEAVIGRGRGRGRGRGKGRGRGRGRGRMVVAKCKMVKDVYCVTDNGSSDDGKIAAMANKRGLQDHQGILDLNVETTSPQLGECNMMKSSGYEDNLDGTEFFEDFDEILVNFSVLHGVGTDKVRTT